MADARLSGSLRSQLGLDALNLLLAMREGFLPYLTMALATTHGSGTSRTLMTVGALAGLAALTPAGVMVDRVRHKRAILVTTTCLVAASGLLLPFVSDVRLALATRSVGAIAGSVFVPVVAAITLGLVGPHRFARRTGRNEAFRHAGTIIVVALAAHLYSAFGSTAIVGMSAFVVVLSIAATLLIPAQEIDDEVARGHEPAVGSSRRTRAGIEYLVLFALLALIFQVAHAATVIPFSRLVAATFSAHRTILMIYLPISTALLVMIPVSLLVGFAADRIGRKPMFVVAFGLLAVQCALYAVADNVAWVVGLRLLDGIAMGIYGVLFSVVVADLTRGTGFFNTALGAVATAQTLGTWLSVSFAGYFFAHVGDQAASLWLAGIAAVGFALYLLVMPETRRVDASTGVADTFA